MTFKECRDWLKGWGDCFPRGGAPRLLALLGRLGAPEAGGRWEAGVASRRPFASVALRYFGPETSFRAWASRAAPLLGAACPGARPPGSGLPWLRLVWDGSSRRPVLARLHSGAGPGEALAEESGGRRLALAVRPIARLLADRAIAGAFEDLGRLCPLRDTVSEWELGEGGARRPLESWSLRLRGGLPWPAAARLSLGEPFVPRSTELAYLLLDRRAREFHFSDGAAWVYFGS